MQSNPQISVDTREQRPYHFANAVIKALPTSDYSILGFEDRIGIERKALGDLLTCIAKIQYRALVVEASLSDLLASGPSEIHPSARLGSLVAWSWKYGIGIWFAGNRELAQRLTHRLLLKAAQYATNNGT
jgi:hypothetical protein